MATGISSRAPSKQPQDYQTDETTPAPETGAVDRVIGFLLAPLLTAAYHLGITVLRRLGRQASGDRQS